MNVAAGPLGAQAPADSGLVALCGVSAYYRIPANPAELRRQLALPERPADFPDLVRAAQASGSQGALGQKAQQEAAWRAAGALAGARARGRHPGLWRQDAGQALSHCRSHHARTPAIFRSTSFTTPSSRRPCSWPASLAARALRPSAFSFRWFLPSIWRYRKPLAHVLVASFFVQTFALVTPLFFQVIIDKVLSHKGYDTLFVLVGGLAVIGLFDVVLQYLRTYALSHTTNRIDVELGRRLFAHLFHLPMSYFETRAAGQTVARVRELETIRSFLTGQGLFSAIDLFFTIVFIAVLAGLFLEAQPDRAVLDPALPFDRRHRAPVLARKDQGEVQPRRRKPANAGRGHRRRPDHQGVRHRARHADAMGGKARGLRLFLLRRRAYRRGRIERHSICPKARQCRAPACSAPRR